MTERPAYWVEACNALGHDDPVMAGLIEAYPDAILITRNDPFQTLARAIVGQQISVQAADAVWARVAERVAPFTPSSVVAQAPDDLARCGLSRRKVEYLVDLAGHFETGQIDPIRWAQRTDHEVIEELVQVRGIGRWTAEMFLIFNLMRPDVWPVDDIGLQKAVAVHYLNDARPTPSALRHYGTRFAPWRTVATWYLWRSLDPVVVQY
jgi:DNA-3-methyladenine glycosylase II